MKNIRRFLIIFLVLFALIVCLFIFTDNTCSYSLVKEEKSVVNQYRLYVNSKTGRHVNGSVDITYLNDKKETIKVDKKGKLIIKSVIKKISNPKRR